MQIAYILLYLIKFCFIMFYLIKFIEILLNNFK